MKRIIGGSGARGADTRFRLDWGWLSGFVAIAGVVAAVLFMAGRDLTLTVFRRELMAMARTAAAYVDASAARQLRPGDEQTEAYARLRSQLDRALAATPGVRYAYLLTPTERPDSFRFLVDTDREAPAAIGEELDARSYPELAAAVQHPAADRTLTADRWGHWLSGYAPVVGPDGKVVAVLGMDLPADEVYRWQAVVALLALLAGVSSAVSVMSVARWLQARASSRMQDLGRKVEQLARQVDGVAQAQTGGAAAVPEKLLAYYERLVEQLGETQERERRLFDQTLRALAAAISTRDSYTGDHSAGVADMVDVLCDELAVPDEDRLHIRYAAAVHDLGKIGVPDHILLKPGPLTPDEFRVLKEHPRVGYELLAQVDALRPVAEIVYAHHERWDGNGYPRGLAADQIPIGARIISAVDAYSAMTTDRPYRKRLPESIALSELRLHAGKQFDPRVADALTRYLEGQAGGTAARAAAAASAAT